jgi:hypothetical protein
VIKHEWHGDPDNDGAPYYYSDYHDGYRCSRCGAFSDCIHCNKNYDDAPCDEQTEYLW